MWPSLLSIPSVRPLQKPGTPPQRTASRDEVGARGPDRPVWGEPTVTTTELQQRATQTPGTLQTRGPWALPTQKSPSPDN